MDWEKLSVEEVLTKLKTSNNGITDVEAKKRLKTYGLNELKEKEKESFIKKFLMQFMDILIALLIVAAIASYCIGDVLDAIVILVVVIINAIVGFLQENKAEKAMDALKSLISHEAIVKRAGEIKKIPSSELTRGDIVLIEEGNSVPADLRLIETYELRIDESSITGESKPIRKTHDIDNINDDRDTIAYMDSSVVLGRGIGVVTEIGMQTVVGKIAEMLQIEETETPLQEKIDNLGKILALISVIICIIIFILQLLKGTALLETFMTAVSLAVAAIPEGLPAILTLTLALGMQRMAKNSAIIRKLLAVETLGSCNVICTDKTGTLTLNEMTVRDARLTDNEFALKICALCNNSIVSEEKIIGDPTDGALLKYAIDNGFKKSNLESEYPRMMEIPLNSVRKRMSTIHQKKGERFIFCKGAPELILEKCSFIQENGNIRPLNENDKKEISHHLQEMTNNALRVLALTYRNLNNDEILVENALEDNLIYVGLIGMIDPPRKEIKEAITQCHNAGVKVVMITGDHKDTATVIAKEIGILEEGGKVLTGQELRNLSDDKFKEIIDDVYVYARVFPEQKVKIVELLQSKDNIVSMTGDGVNDAPALKKASIGVAMGITGTDVAKEASDMILQDDNFATIVEAIKEGRTIFDNIRRFIKFQVSTNVGAIVTIVIASIVNLPIPFNPIQLLWINIIMDGPPAQSLGVEPPGLDVMSRNPEKKRILPRADLIKIISSGLVMAIGTLGVYIFELSNGVTVIKASTMALTVFIMFQLFNVFNCKSETSGFSNKLLIGSVVVSLLLQLLVIYLPFFQEIFRTTSIGFIDWMLIIVISGMILITDKLFSKII